MSGKEEVTFNQPSDRLIRSFIISGDADLVKDYLGKVEGTYDFDPSQDNDFNVISFAIFKNASKEMFSYLLTKTSPATQNLVFKQLRMVRFTPEQIDNGIIPLLKNLYANQQALSEKISSTVGGTNLLSKILTGNKDKSDDLEFTQWLLQQMILDAAAIQQAISENRFDVVKLILQTMYKSGKDSIPSLDVFLSHAIKNHQPTLVRTLLLYGAKATLDDVQAVQDVATLDVLCTFGYGIGAFLKISPSTELSNACLLGADVGNKPFELVGNILTVADLYKADADISQIVQGVPVENAKNKLKARIFSDWSFWVNSSYDPFIMVDFLEQNSKIDSLDFYEKVIPAQMDRLFSLRYSLRDRYAENKNPRLKLSIDNYFPRFTSLIEIAQEGVIQLVNNGIDENNLNKIPVKILTYILKFQQSSLSVEAHKLVSNYLEKRKNEEVENEAMVLPIPLQPAPPISHTLLLEMMKQFDGYLEKMNNEMFIKKNNDCDRIAERVIGLLIISALCGALGALPAAFFQAVKSNGEDWDSSELHTLGYFVLAGASIPTLCVLICCACLLVSENIPTDKRSQHAEDLATILAAIAAHYKDSCPEEADQLAALSLKLYNKPWSFNFHRTIMNAKAKLVLIDHKADAPDLPANFKGVTVNPTSNVYRLGDFAGHIGLFPKAAAKLPKKKSASDRMPLLSNKV